MSSLYVANFTKQFFVFMYRVPERDSAAAANPALSGIREHKIAPGDQVRIPLDLSPEQIKYIIDKHKAFGFPDTNELKNKRTFTGTCYSIDKPVPIDQFLEAYESNDKALNTASEERMQQSSLAIASRLQAVSPATPLTHAAVEVVEETKGATPSIAAGVEFVAAGSQPRHLGARTRRTQ
jgi:hypothetical protein